MNADNRELKRRKIRQRDYNPGPYDEGQRIEWGHDDHRRVGEIVGPGPKPGTVWVLADTPDYSGERWAVVRKPSKSEPEPFEVSPYVLSNMTVSQMQRVFAAVSSGAELHREVVSYRYRGPYQQTRGSVVVHVSPECPYIGEAPASEDMLSDHHYRMGSPVRGFDAMSILQGRTRDVWGRATHLDAHHACPCLVGDIEVERAS